MSDSKSIQDAAREMAKAGARKGGIARAKALSPEQRRDIARYAVRARWQRAGLLKEDSEPRIPQATHEGILPIADAVISCAVLEDGTRVLSERGVTKALGGKRGGAHWRRKKADPTGANLPVFASANNIKSFIDKDLETALSSPLIYRSARGAIANGLRAELLPRVCETWLKARDANQLLPSQEHIAAAADMLMRALAKVGIIALVDEATGYQEVRDRLALQKILEKYIRDEYAKWTKRFPDEFYKQLFRLRNIPYPPTVMKRPAYVGHWTNDIVYSRLAPGVLAKLREKNPVQAETGYRRWKHHQYLTEDIGIPELQRHLENVIFLMRSCTDWDDFKRRLDIAAPTYGKTIPLEFHRE